MMNHLLSYIEEAQQSLLNTKCVNKFSIQSVQGKNVYRIVSLILGAMKTMQRINKMAEDVVRMLINIADTTSVDALVQLTI
jgi:hypothetical protein